MPLPLIPSQEIYFYTNAWTEEMDRYFLQALVSYKLENGRLGSDIPSNEIMRAQRALNSHFGVDMTEEVLIHRLEILGQRYRSFKKLRAHKYVQFHDEANKFIARDDIWAAIFERNHFAKAYYHKGEPEYNKLCILFGMDDIKHEKDNNIIILSDSSPRVPNDAYKQGQCKDEDDEVSSPIPLSARRMLFESRAMEMDIDQESTCNMGAHYSRQVATSSTMFPPRNAFPPPHKGSSSKLKKKLYSSSCGSSSPNPSNKK